MNKFYKSLVICCGAGLAFGSSMLMATAENVPASNASTAAAPTSSTLQAGLNGTGAARPADPENVLSVDACVKCHANEVQVWRNTPHSKTFEELHRRPEAKEIARKLGVRSIKYDDRCIGCHYTQQLDGDKSVTISGVSCESCHGASRLWLEKHHDYGGPTITRLTETPEHRRQRVADAVAHGMRNPENVYLVAQSCYRCHTVQDEQLVNVGGHSAGSIDFEFVSWSQGTVRHNFARTDGQSNEPSSAGRLRLMFVAGMIADLEASLRATANATTVENYGVNAANRAARAAARLRSVAEKTNHETVKRITAIYGEVEMRINNRTQLIAAADEIAKLGFEFAAASDPAELEKLEAFVPPTGRWK